VSKMNLHERRRHYRRGYWNTLEKVIDGVQGPSDTHSWSDSAGDSILFRCGDFYAVGYWTGEDMVFIYEVNKDQDLCESLTALDPIFSEQVYPLSPLTP
jgi:hypothetical protein